MCHCKPDESGGQRTGMPEAAVIRLVSDGDGISVIILSIAEKWECFDFARRAAQALGMHLMTITETLIECHCAASQLEEEAPTFPP